MDFVVGNTDGSLRLVGLDPAVNACHAATDWLV